MLKDRSRAPQTRRFLLRCVRKPDSAVTDDFYFLWGFLGEDVFLLQEDRGVGRAALYGRRVKDFQM